MVLAGALVWMTQSWDRLRGHLNYLRLQEMKSGWHAQSQVPHDRDLNRSFQLGYRALEHERASPDYRFMLASLHAWRERGLYLWPEQAAAESRKIIENLKSALVRRPSWFEAWMLLALVKYQSNEIDHELKVALEKSMDTGRYETVVQHGLAYVGLRVWDDLGPALKERIFESLQAALSNPAVNEFVVEQIVATGRVELYRDTLESRQNLAALMNRFLERRKDAL